MDTEDSGPTACLNFHIPLTATIDVDGWMESRLRIYWAWNGGYYADSKCTSTSQPRPGSEKFCIVQELSTMISQVTNLIS